ncbi:hypothetical protein GGI11_006831, partial [Coemansia sp. RSA 2049]
AAVDDQGARGHLDVRVQGRPQWKCGRWRCYRRRRRCAGCRGRGSSRHDAPGQPGPPGRCCGEVRHHRARHGYARRPVDAAPPDVRGLRGDDAAADGSQSGRLRAGAPDSRGHRAGSRSSSWHSRRRRPGARRHSGAGARAGGAGGGGADAGGDARDAGCAGGRDVRADSAAPGRVALAGSRGGRADAAAQQAGGGAGRIRGRAVGAGRQVRAAGSAADAAAAHQRVQRRVQHRGGRRRWRGLHQRVPPRRPLGAAQRRVGRNQRRLGPGAAAAADRGPPPVPRLRRLPADPDGRLLAHRAPGRRWSRRRAGAVRVRRHVPGPPVPDPQVRCRDGRVPGVSRPDRAQDRRPQSAAAPAVQDRPRQDRRRVDSPAVRAGRRLDQGVQEHAAGCAVGAGLRVVARRPL